MTSRKLNKNEPLNQYVEELILMTSNGKNGKERNTAIEERQYYSKNKNIMIEHSKEIRPEQVIPFNDEDDFKDF